MKKTCDAVEILHKRYINTFWRKVVFYCWHKPLLLVEDLVEKYGN